MAAHQSIEGKPRCWNRECIDCQGWNISGATALGCSHTGVKE